jgi:SET domain-containing protein
MPICLIDTQGERVAGKTPQGMLEAHQAGHCTELESKDAYAVKVHVWVGTSHIAGQGLFAAQTIKKGTRILQYIGQKIAKEETAERVYHRNQYIFTFNDRSDIDGKTLKNKARYINHSCDPNCEILITQRTIWIVAKRDIQAGEELRYNYGFTAKQYHCQCGASNCCGYILGEEYWDL